MYILSLFCVYIYIQHPSASAAGFPPPHQVWHTTRHCSAVMVVSVFFFITQNQQLLTNIVVTAAAVALGLVLLLCAASAYVPRFVAQTQQRNGLPFGLYYSVLGSHLLLKSTNNSFFVGPFAFL